MDCVTQSSTSKTCRPVRARARELRHPLTQAEMVLWQGLRNRQLGMKFRRQHPIGTLIVDLYCHQAKLIVEIDGEVHGTPGQIARDAARTEWLEERGYRVIRFRNDEVLRDARSVLNAIGVAIAQLPSPALRERGRG
ncbi:MAG TPA: endonuclease domain-containing protein [Anaerolineales bacterium]|nr:endonuclease domain-containing protein [Anaerolineales bacterium]